MNDQQEKLNNLLELVKNQETRIDYNFNTIIQMTILSEYIFSKLSDNFPDLKMHEDFEEFQKQRVDEFNNMLEELDKTSEEVKAASEDIIKNLNL